MLKVLELFAGYGSQALALENLGLDFTSDISEIDKYAIDAYHQIHGQTKNYGDICGIDETELPEYDLITYSSPCQDFSVAGKMKGGQKGSGTRSSLLWECERIIRAVKPKYLLMENVKNLVGKKFLPCFKAWLRTLEELGYNNYWKVLNAKDYGVPQNRERVFVVSIRKDLNQTYMFPEPVPLKMRLKDLLEPEVDESFYLPQEKVEALKIKEKNVSNAVRCGGRGTLDGKHTWDVVSVLRPERTEYGKAIRKEYEAGNIQESRHNMTEMKPRTDGVSNTLTTVQKDNLVMQIGNIFDTDSFGGNPQAGRVYSAEGLSPCLNTMAGGGQQPKVLVIKANTKKGYDIAEEGDSINLEQPNSTTRRGRIGKGKGKAQTLTTSCNQGVLEIGIGHNPISKKFEFDGFHDQPAPTLLATDYKAPKCYSNGIRVRKLTPKECWRLMGVKDEQFGRLHGISKTQLYKMAGNSIVVDVLMAIFKNLLISDKETKGQLSLF